MDSLWRNANLAIQVFLNRVVYSLQQRLVLSPKRHKHFFPAYFSFHEKRMKFTTLTKPRDPCTVPQVIPNRK